MSHQSSADKELADMTECSICFDVFTDPRVLPCIHTLCLKCLQDYGKNRRSGNRLSCALCRKQFIIPRNGLSGMPTNFLVNKLFHIRELLAEKEEQQISRACKELADMTKCSLCTNVFTDPRALPCIHTFCLKCLLDYGKNRRPGKRMPCPLCKKLFTIHRDGLSGMPKNFFVMKLFHIRELLAKQEEQQIPRTYDNVIPKGNGVGGVASLGDEVFVVRYLSQQKIEVYDANVFTLQRHIIVPGLGDFPFAIVACSRNNCLYASDSDNDSVHRVELSGRNAVMKWPVARWPAGLSVDNEHSLLLVVSKIERKLQVFTTHGIILQDIQLANIECPFHAIQLPAGGFLVSHSGSLHGVSLLGFDGAVVYSYGRRWGSELMQMNEPRGTAVDREGRVLVADMNNNRLLVTNKLLWDAHQMSVSVIGGLQGPCSLWYDQSRRRLYIGESFGGRVIVIDSLKDFSIRRI